MSRNYYAELYYHFVWQTKGRLRLITPDAESRIWASIKTKCIELGAYPIEVGGIEDHVHLLVSVPPTLSLSEFIGKVKGNTSHMANVTMNLSHRFHWGEGYGVLSLAKRNASSVRRYIQDQKEHHARKTINAIMERIEPLPEAISTSK